MIDGTMKPLTYPYREPRIWPERNQALGGSLYPVYNGDRIAYWHGLLDNGLFYRHERYDVVLGWLNLMLRTSGQAHLGTIQ